jgi:hypothetical protein
VVTVNSSRAGSLGKRLEITIDALAFEDQAASRRV